MMQWQAFERMFACFQITDRVIDAENQLRMNESDFLHSSIDFVERFKIIGNRMLMSGGEFS